MVSNMVCAEVLIFHTVLMCILHHYKTTICAAVCVRADPIDILVDYISEEYDPC